MKKLMRRSWAGRVVQSWGMGADGAGQGEECRLGGERRGVRVNALRSLTRHGFGHVHMSAIS